MIKILLAVSLILNVVLGILYYQVKREPPLERFIMENKHEQVKIENVRPAEKSPEITPKAKTKVKELTDAEIQTEVDAIVVQDEHSFVQASEELSRAQNSFLEEMDLSESLIKKKTKLTVDFYQTTGVLHQKTPRGVRMSFKNRRKELELEEKLHKDYAKLLGDKNWEKYRTWVDNYNQNLLKNHKSREFSPLMMSY
jgi:hypothetical protein